MGIICTTIIPPTDSIAYMLRVSAKVTVKLIMKLGIFGRG
jgi:hypothetical protein